MPRTPEDIHDEWLVLAAQSGEAHAFETLMRRWLPVMARHARRLTGDQEAASDVTQEACLAIVRGLGRLDDPAAFEPWVRRIVAHKAADWVRRRQHQRQVEGAIASEIVEARGGGRRTGVLTEPAEIVRLVRETIERLPLALQTIVGIHYGEGRSVAEAAALLNVPAGTVKSRLFSARQRFKSIITLNDDVQTRRRR